MVRLCRLFCLISVIVGLYGCGDRSALAPVVDGLWNPSGRVHTYVVSKGDTLYSIAFRYDLDYRTLARYNHLSSPYTLRVGQVLRLQPNAAITHQTVNRNNRTNHPVVPNKPIALYTPTYQYKNGAWLWPAEGQIVATFNPQAGKKGIDIAGKKGAVVRASFSGVVAYAGSGLKGYGNLIIIKHNNHCLTAYGNNLKNLVREGQYVKAGQEIALMGAVEQRYWGLHFEIRKSGVPVNPLNYLKKG